MYRSAKFTLSQIENAKSEMLCKSRRETWRVSPHWCSAELVLDIALGWMEGKRLWLGKQCYLWHFSQQKDTSSLEIVHILKQTHFFSKFQLSACLEKHNIWILLSLNTWQRKNQSGSAIYWKNPEDKSIFLFKEDWILQFIPFSNQRNP